LFDGRFRSAVDKSVGPVGSALARTGLSPDHLTALGLIMAIPAGLAIATGRLGLGLVLLIVAAVPDLLDGALAKASGRASVRGAFFDSVSDRVTDAIILGGVAWYLQSSRHGHAGLLAFGVLAVSMLISYERAKAESLGFSAKGGLMERAERIILLCVGLVASVILVPILWVMLILTAVTAVQRFVKVWRQATTAGKVASGLGGGTAGSPNRAGVSSRAAGGHDHSDGAGTVASSGERGQPAGVGAGAPAGDLTFAVSERWRAWRQQSSSGQATGRMTPAGRPNGAGRDADGTHRATTRWEERRAARLRDSNEGESDSRNASGRRHSTRRP
jgi:CDP-diacylglycerol--glycerol-3-phosphate 3-phosphatidyltransferase